MNWKVGNSHSTQSTILGYTPCLFERESNFVIEPLAAGTVRNPGARLAASIRHLAIRLNFNPRPVSSASRFQAAKKRPRRARRSGKIRISVALAAGSIASVVSASIGPRLEFKRESA